MGSRRSAGNPLATFSSALGLGIALGALLAFGLSEERRHGIRKTVFELKELPFRFLL